jgi:hypothetical protein
MAEYCGFEATLPVEVRGSLEKTDTLVQQLCALQYIPRSPRRMKNLPHSTVAYINAKKLVKGRGAHSRPVEQIVKPLLTMKWVRYYFKPEYVRLVIKHLKQWHLVEIGIL